MADAQISLTPLLEFIREISTKEGEADKTVVALRQVMAFSGPREQVLGSFDDLVRVYLTTQTDLPDLSQWMESYRNTYYAESERLAKVVRGALALVGPDELVDFWDRRLKELTKRGDSATGKTTILCAFSSSVDATLRIDGTADSLNRILQRAACFAGYSDVEKFVRDSYGLEHLEREEIDSIMEAIAALIYAYEKPSASLKPNLKPGSEAEQWVRALFLDPDVQRDITGGGGSMNIADALAGLGIQVAAFWAYHPTLLSSLTPPCSRGVNLRIYHFDADWTWTPCHFGEQRPDDPVRLSVILSFTPDSTPIAAGVPKPVSPGGTGRLIYQFKGHRSPGFFQPGKGETAKWKNPNYFCRWWRQGSDEKGLEAPETPMEALPQYDRVILSGFQRLKETAHVLGRQCKNMRVHHEIAGTFTDSRQPTLEYCEVLGKVLDQAKSRTAGINEEELSAFTSWEATPVFAGAAPAMKDSLLQRLFRAIKVRDFFRLEWLYVHGNDIDIMVVDRKALPEKEKLRYLEQLREAMLMSKVVVFAAMHVRSGISQVPKEFGPTCAAKGLVALCQFADAFARQYGKYYPNSKSDTAAERDRIQTAILREGIVCDDDGPVIVTVPVYWPKPARECTITGAGDISSGVTAAFAP